MMKTVEFLTANIKTVENMAKKQIASRLGLSAVMSYEDIVNDVFVKAMEGKMEVEGNPYTTIYYTIQNITRNEVNRLKRLAPIWDTEQIEIVDHYENITEQTISYTRNEKEISYTREKRSTVTYTRKETVIKGMKAVQNRKDVRTIQEKSIAGNFADKINERVDMASMFSETEKKVLSLMMQDTKKRDIDIIMGQRCDRIYKRIEFKLQAYMRE
ncbi:hypothetical protein [Brevibacillus laterosporus]|uniref:hypothetical protein n=1 Tax=Brevibacillus laterosporus TaxID=1465 RepID=UPI00215B8898|nr:hypothetical protein [Brevibacillus laterosporus]MCR8994624.1 hypothetical protein [Brevibacillus laterosporus]